MRYKIKFEDRDSFLQLLKSISKFKGGMVYSINIYRNIISIQSVSPELKDEIERLGGEVVPDYQYIME